jgi:integrase
VNRIEEFITSSISDAAINGYEPSKLKPALGALTRWSTKNGVPLDRSAVFARANIAAFIDKGLPRLSPGTRGNYRSQLLRVAEALLDESLAPRPLSALAPSDPSVPYTDEEQGLLREWTAKQPKSRRADAGTLVALGLGAGLSAQEIVNLRARDILPSTTGAVLVRVTEGRMRTVPLLRRWERTVLRRATELSGDDYLFIPGRTGGGKNLISNFVARGAGQIHVQTQRMRGTWIVSHMAASSPLPELVEAAGVDSLEAFTRYLRYVPARDAADSVKSLRSAA